MPPRVTYWTGTWDPDKEGISKEIAALRTGTRATAPVVAFSPAQQSALRPSERVLLLSHRRWILLRLAAGLIEPTGQITHIFGGSSSWHLIRALGRRPIVLTAAIAGDGAAKPPHTRIARVVVETEDVIGEWLDAGVPRERIEIVRPGIDLEWHRSTARPAGARPALLFASTPSDPGEFEVRGIPLLVQLARARPGLDIVVPWRQWGDVQAAGRALAELAPPPNFIVEHAAVTDMRERFARASATVLPFARGAGKASPNFVLEGLAAGRPCITTAGGSLAELIASRGAGLAADRTVESLAASVDRCLEAWDGFAARARRLAEEEFDLRTFRASYERLYEIVARSAAR